MREIKIGQGLGEIKFGISREELEKIMGKPDELENYSYSNSEEDKTESWHYDKLDVSFSFDEQDDWELGAISITSKDYLFNGKALIGKTEEEALNFITSIYPEDIKHEFSTFDDDQDRILVDFEDLGLNFWFMNGILEEIEWSVLWDENDMQIWPE